VRWNLAAATLSASAGFIAVIVDGIDLSAEALVFYRLVLAAATVLAGAAIVRRLDILRVSEQRPRLVVLGAVLGAHWLLFFGTIKLSSVAVAVLTTYTAPLLLAAVAPIVLPEHRSRIVLLALVPAAVGLGLIALAGEQGTHARPIAIAAGVGAAITYAAAVIMAKQLTVRLPVPAIQFWNYCVAAMLTAPFLLLAGRVLPRADEVGFVLLLGVLFTAGYGVGFVWLLRKVTTQAISTLGYLEPVAAALLAWPILGQELGWAVLTGGALIIGAGLLVILFEPVETPPLEAPAGVGSARGPVERGRTGDYHSNRA
jgi:drug/metabolite transporter (DMT)-like permease